MSRKGFAAKNAGDRLVGIARAPPRGYKYVRSGNDAILVSSSSGIVAAIIANVVR